MRCFARLTHVPLKQVKTEQSKRNEFYYGISTAGKSDSLLVYIDIFHYNHSMNFSLSDNNKLNNLVNLGTASFNWWMPGLLLCIFVAWLFWPAVNFPFIYLDDSAYVFNNSLVMSGLNKETLIGITTSKTGSYWLPLTQISFALDRTFFGSGPAGFHRTNVLLHTFNVFILYTILLRWTGSIWKSILVAALFGIHPLRVESVAWVTERKDVLSTFFIFSSLGCWGEYILRRSRSWYFFSLVFMVMGCMAKSNAVVIPALLFLVDWWPLKRTWARNAVSTFSKDLWAGTKDKLPFCLISAVFIAVTMLTTTDIRWLMQETSLSARLGMVSHVYLHYLYALIWPVQLTFHDPEIAWAGIDQGQLIRWISIVGITTIAWKLRNRFSYILCGWLWYLITLAPSSGLVTVVYMSPDDRFSYVPSIGLCIIVAWGLGELADRSRTKKSVVAATILALFVLTLLTMTQLDKWKDGISLFEYVSRAQKESSFAHRQLAFHYLYFLNDRISAEAHFRQAIAANPESAESYNYGVFLAEDGRDDEAIEAYRRCLELNPNDINARVNLIVLTAGKGRREEASLHFKVLQDFKICSPELDLDSWLNLLEFN